MPSLTVIIWSALLALPGPVYPRGMEPETCAERAERLTVIAHAVVLETADADLWHDGWTREDWAWAAVAKTYAESGRFDVRVHDGRLRGDRGASVCLGQIMYGGAQLVGVSLEATRRCYREVFRHLYLHAMRCRVFVPTQTGLARVFGAYGTGRTCHARFDWAQRRAWMWARLRHPPK